MAARVNTMLLRSHTEYTSELLLAASCTSNPT